MRVETGLELDMSVCARLLLASKTVVGLRLNGGTAEQRKDAERAVTLLAPSFEFDHKFKCWTFPLCYLGQVNRVLKEHVSGTTVSENVAREYRRQRKLRERTLALKAKPFDTFPAAPYESIFRPEYIPRPYQRQGIAIMLAARRLLLGDAVGLGKTIQSIGAIAQAMKQGACRRAMVVTQASLKGQWQDETVAYLRPEAVGGLAAKVVVVRGDRNERTAIYRNPESAVFIVNYELFLHDLDVMPPVDMIILDEAAKIKNIGSQTYGNITHYCRRHGVGYRYALTATPIETRLEDLFSILSFLGHRLLGFHTYFLYHYCKLRQFKAPNGAQIRQVVGHMNLDEARDRTAHAILRRTKDDAKLKLPELVIRNMMVDLKPEQREMYEMFKKGLVQKSGAPIDPLQQSLFLREVCDSLALIEGSGSAASAKLDELEYLVKEVFTTGQSIIIFTQWKRMADLIVKRLSKHYSVKPRLIAGNTKETDRDRHRRDFNDRKFRCLVMTDAGKAGLNLQACETMVNFELPWNPAVLKQRIGRMHRQGQKHDVTTVVNLIADETIEQRVTDRLIRRHRVFDVVLTAAEDELQVMDLTRTLTLKELVELA